MSNTPIPARTFTERDRVVARLKRDRTRALLAEAYRVIAEARAVLANPLPPLPEYVGRHRAEA